MSRFSGPQHKGAQAVARSERRTEADKRNALTAPERRRAYRKSLTAEKIAVGSIPLVTLPAPTEPTKRERKRNRK